MCYSWDQGALQSFGQCYGHRGGTMLPALERPGFLAFPFFSLSWSFQCQCAVAVGGELTVCCS